MRGGAEEALDVVAVEVGDAEQVPAGGSDGGRSRRRGVDGLSHRALLRAPRGRRRPSRPSSTRTRSCERGRDVLADVVRADRQLAVPAVDEDGELDARGSAVLEQRVDRGADRASGEEHVVDEHDGLAPRAGSRAPCPARSAAAWSGGPPPRTSTSSRWKVMSTAPMSTAHARALGDERRAGGWRAARRGCGCRRARARRDRRCARSARVRSGRACARPRRRRARSRPRARPGGCVVIAAPFRPRCAGLKGSPATLADRPVGALPHRSCGREGHG